MSVPQKTREYRLPKVDGFHNLTLQEAAIPKLQATEVLLKVHAVSLQSRDLQIATGHYPFGQKENLVPGSDVAGEIVAIGQDIKGWKIGDRVTSSFFIDDFFGEINGETCLGGPIDGVLTEYKVLPAHALVRIPEHLSYEEASTLPCAAVTAYNALFGPKPLKGGDIVLVQGTGGVSIFGLQIAVASGATVIATSSSDEKLQAAKKLGAAHVINYKKTPDWDKEVLKITSGRGVDHVIEVGGPGTLLKSLNAVRYGGSIHLVGFIAGQADVNSLPLQVLGKAALLRGILIGSRSQFEDLNRLISAVKLKPVVGKVFDFERAQEAYAYLSSQKHVGKVIIKVSKN
ncbi:NAD-P-binding protein [Fomes fomentarius]|nr:NAD-P-binding protein [Fomes fomentarius]